MKKFILLLVIFLIVAGCGPQKSLVSDIANMTVKVLPNKKVVVYTPDKNAAEIEEFLSIYNRAAPRNGESGTTPLVSVQLLYKDGEKTYVNGGNEGHQTVVEVKKTGRGQRMLQSAELEEYMAKFIE